MKGILKVNPSRWQVKDLWKFPRTGILVHAQTPEGKEELADLVFLDEKSLEKHLQEWDKAKLISLIKRLLLYT